MKILRKKLEGAGARSNLDLSLQDTLGNGLAAVIVLTLIAASFSGAGKDLYGKRGATPAPGIVLTATRPVESTATRTISPQIMDVWVLARAEVGNDAPVSFRVDAVNSRSAAVHDQYVRAGAVAVFAARASMGVGGKLILESVNGGDVRQIRGGIRVFVGNREAPDLAFQSNLPAQSSKKLFTVCMPKYGDVRIQEHEMSTSIRC